MADIRNEFSWSVSRSQQFQNCQRAYYFHYYGYWMGWNEDAPERTRKIYILRNMKPLVLWAGIWEKLVFAKQRLKIVAYKIKRRVYKF